MAFNGLTSIVIGPMKAGTTWIHNYLASRGDVCLPRRVKETFFFDRYYQRGSEWYGCHFQHYDQNEHRGVVEIAPSLFHSKEAPARIRDVLGSVQVIVARRDPITRSWSHYWHLRRRGYTQKQFNEAIADFPEIITASQYDIQIERWQKCLIDSTFAEIHLEQLAVNPDAYAAQLCDAMSLPFVPVSKSLKNASNKSVIPPSFTAAKIGRKLSQAARGMGFYRTVNFAKSLGLKPLFFGSADNEGTPPPPSTAERKLLTDLLGL